VCQWGEPATDDRAPPLEFTPLHFGFFDFEIRLEPCDARGKAVFEFPSGD